MITFFETSLNFFSFNAYNSEIVIDYCTS